jgi:hypothetical protein
MTAAEARRIATDNNFNGAAEQLDTIKKMIKEAANRGEFKVWIYSIPLKPEVKMRLEADGYRVHAAETDRNETATKITW